jgi:UrcA family protein
MVISMRTLNCAFAISTLALPLAANLAIAAPPSASAIVQLGDLDLATDAGVRVLYHRIKDAAEFVCYRETSVHAGIDQQARYANCFDHVVATAVKQVGQERLVALHRDQSRLAAN